MGWMNSALVFWQGTVCVALERAPAFPLRLSSRAIEIPHYGDGETSCRVRDPGPEYLFPRSRLAHRWCGVGWVPLRFSLTGNRPERKG
jgi:hypothetical protein